MGDFIKSILKKKLTKKLIVIIILIVVIGIIVLPSQYVIELDEGTYKEEDNSNAQYVAKKEINQALFGDNDDEESTKSNDMKVTFSKNSGFSLDIDLDDIATNIIETLDTYGGNLGTYLSEKGQEEILRKMIKAELITQYPDLRYPSKMDNDVKDAEFQGAIKFIRHKGDGTETTLQYIPLGNEDSTDIGTLYGMINHLNNGGTIPNKASTTYYEGLDEKDLKRISYVGDSWMVGLKKYADSKNKFFTAKNGATASTIGNVNIKDNSTAVVIMLGMEDPSSQEDMKTLISKLQAESEGKTIYVLKVFHVGKDYVSDDGKSAEEYNSLIDIYNNDISAYCETLNNVEFVDATTGMIDSEGYLSSTYKESENSLNEEGYKKLYENIKANLKGKTVTADIKLESDNLLDYFSLDSSGNLIIATYTQTQTKEIEGSYETQYFDKETDKSQYYFNKEKAIFDSTPMSVETKYTTKEIKYKTVISNYTMSFDYLWDFLVAGRDEQFVSDLADLVLDSEIEVSIYDFSNMSEGGSIQSYNVNDWELTTTRTRKWVNGTVEDYNSGTWDESKAKITTTRYYSMYYTKSYHNTIAYVAPTYVDIWYMTQTAEYEYEPAGSYNDWEVTRLYESDETLKSIDSLKNEQDKWQQLGVETDSNEGTTTITELCNVAKRQTINNQYLSADINSAETCKYTLKSDSPVVTEKIDKTLKEGDEGYPNFCTLFLESESARNNIIGAESWLFEILERNESTVNMVDLTKYLLYRTMGLDYGVTEYDLEIFHIIDFTKISSSSQLLIEYIHYWEMGGEIEPGSAYLTADEQFYIVHNDGAGHPTVGYGVDIYNCGYTSLFQSAGYDLSIGSKIPVEFVDSIEEMELQDKIAGVEAEVTGLGLTGYQINALVSRAYNAGTYGAVGQYRNGKKFTQAYTEYWKEEEDDKYEELKEKYDDAETKYKDAEQQYGETSTECKTALNEFEKVKKEIKGDYSHKLYDTYMDEPVTSNGSYLSGLETRRKSEWTLFQTGYYDVLDKWHFDGGALVAAAYEVGEYFNQYKIHYAGNDVSGVANNGRSCVWNSIQKAYDLPVQYPGSYGFVCATYVSFALWKSGLCTEAELSAINYNLVSGVADLLISKGWTVINDFSELEPGDVMIMPGHIAIYVGDGYYIDQSYCVVRASGVDDRGNLIGASPAKFTYALRAP